MNRKRVAGITAAVLILAVLPFITFLFLKKGNELRGHRKVPNFQLVNSDGSPFASSQLDGKVYVVEFTFTRCMSIVCDKLDSMMHVLDDRFGSNPSFQLLTITVDPKWDTPEVMSDFSRERQGEWVHLTGQEEQVTNLILGGFFAKGDSKQGTQFSSKADAELCLVDGTGLIKGYFNALEEVETKQLVEDVEGLLNKTAP